MEGLKQVFQKNQLDPDGMKGERIHPILSCQTTCTKKAVNCNRHKNKTRRRARKNTSIHTSTKQPTWTMKIRRMYSLSLRLLIFVLMLFQLLLSLLINRNQFLLSACAISEDILLRLCVAENCFADPQADSRLTAVKRSLNFNSFADDWLDPKVHTDGSHFGQQSEMLRLASAALPCALYEEPTNTVGIAMSQSVTLVSFVLGSLFQCQ